MLSFYRICHFVMETLKRFEVILTPNMIFHVRNIWNVLSRIGVYLYNEKPRLHKLFHC